MKRNLPGQEGYILVAALLAAVVIFAASFAVASRITSEVKIGRNAEDHEQAWHAAMAGLEECLAYIRHDPAGQAGMVNPAIGTKVCDQSHSVHGVSYTVQAFAATARQVKVVSTGRAGKTARKAGAILQVALGTEQGPAAWGGGTLRFSGDGTLDGDLYSVDSIDIAGTFTVCGNIYAAGEASRGGQVVNGPTCNVGFHSQFPFVKFPDFKVDLLRQKASIIIEGDHTPICPDDDPASRGPDCDGPVDGEQVVWVKGRLSFNPYSTSSGKTYKDVRYTGRVIYVVDNVVHVNIDNVDLAHTGSLQVLAAGQNKGITVSSNGTIRGVWVAPEGPFETAGTLNLIGLVFAKEWVSRGTLHWIAGGQSVVCTGTECASSRMSIVKLWEE